ncbi:hypothetical protein [Glaciecola sp. 1036]|uniref:hypothetical protein n=1 Tax=Alteromonadaceae TaxID=72275 RepID=UPI003CFC52AE
MKFSTLLIVVFCGLLFSTSVYSTEKQCEQIEAPIVFDQYGLPTLELIINGESNFALIDLGSRAGIHLPVSTISSISNVKYTGETSNTTNISGEVFTSKEFVVPMMAIGCMKFENIIGYELNPWAASIGDKPEGEEENLQLVIGQGFFGDKQIVIDYLNKKLTVSNKNSALESTDNSKFKPYELSDEGITIQMSSSLADYQMVLDTGASSSIFSLNKVDNNEPLTECNYDLGPDVQCKIFTSEVNIAGFSFVPNLLLYPIDPRFTKDGLLGSDFFNKFTVALDFSNNRIAISPNESSKL